MLSGVFLIISEDIISAPEKPMSPVLLFHQLLKGEDEDEH